jgi:hypothetical protein
MFTKDIERRCMQVIERYPFWTYVYKGYRKKALYTPAPNETF